MELFKLSLPDRNQLGFQWAVVSEPAIESETQFFSKYPVHEQFKVVSEERRIVMGYAMIADKKIPRYSDQRGAYNVVFDRKGCDLAVETIMMNSLTKNVNENHQTNQFAEGVFLKWIFQIDSELGIKAPDGFETEADGSVFMCMKIENDSVWDKFKQGIYRGISIEGKFIEEKFGSTIESQLESFLQSLA